jgi:oligopeptide transport system ATP-binding protein
MEPLLEIEGLSVTFRSDAGPVPAVEDVSLSLSPGETLAIVGESGSGKSVTALAMMGLLGRGAMAARRLDFGGRSLIGLSDADWGHIRGREIGMIFQDPMTSLNPVLTIGRQLTEVFELHMGLSGAAARDGAVELLERVGVPSATSRLGQYPHHFSGGMRQRVMIAMAVACRPRILIADEPTTALDVTIQAQILEIIADLQKSFGMAIVMITHDLGVVAGIADRVAVMYAGRVVEEGPTERVFAAPRMPYTRGLLASVPRFDDDAAELVAIPGQPPDPRHRPPGCAFAPRCGLAMAACDREQPALRPMGGGQSAACLRTDATALAGAAR